MSTERCDPEIFEKGTVVLVFHAMAIVTEPWVQKLAAESGQRVDWSYGGGYAHVQVIGDCDRVREVAARLKPELEKACAERTPWELAAWRFVFE